MLRSVQTEAIALIAICAALPALAGPIAAGARPGGATWEEHGAGRTDGLSVGAYPLPPRSGPDVAALEADPDGTAKERWLRRHFQWLRALRSVAIAVSQEERQGETRPAGLAPAPSEPAPASQPGAGGKLQIADMVILYSAEEDDRVTPHLLDDGARNEDPDLAFRGGEAFEFVVSDRLSTETTQIVAQFFAPLSKGVRSYIGLGLAALGDGVQAQSERYDLAPLGHQILPDAQYSGAPARAQGRRETPTLGAFVKRIAIDVLSAPTTYLLSLLALLGWLVLRATVFSRS